MAIPVVLALVLGVGLGMRGRPEPYPHAQWAMFSRVPASLDLWTLRIHAVDGEPVDGAPLVHDVPALADAFAGGGALRQVDRYGRALLAVQSGSDERREELQRTQRQVERRFGDHEVEYAVVNVRGNPLELLDGAPPEREVNLGTFSAP